MFSSFQRELGAETLVFETGKLAQQAGGSVFLRYGDNVLLVTATMSKPREGIDFFPLTIEFEERMYAKGKIPGNFFRREGRPSTQGTLTARLTDRPIRPLFPKGFKNEVQVIITPMSVDGETPIDVFAIIGASAALGISEIPFEGPIAATRMGYIDGELIVNPSYAQIGESELDLIVAGSKNGVVMMEAGAHQLPEDLIIEAVERAQEVNLGIIDFQEEVVSSVGKPKAAFKADVYPVELDEKITELLNGKIRATFGASDSKAEQGVTIKELQNEALEKFGEDYESKHVLEAFEWLLEQEFKYSVLNEGKRPDGRQLKEIRPISSEVSLLPRAHGTGLFTRGETQILGIATLGSSGDAQRVENLTPEESRRFMLHYNFPPYSTGEARRVGGPGRREVGHGMLAERALAPVIPSEEEFPYTLRLVCEALSSNGSTSMGSVCAGTLALMDAGVPIKAPIAGISVGLVTGDDGQHVALTDIQGLEDHIGDMDFKVAGSRDGITAIQLDIKAKSINMNVVRDALEQAREARLFILDKLNESIAEVRPDLSPYAPRMTKIMIPTDKIGALIGPGGSTIRKITGETGTTIDIQEDGSVTVGATDGEASKKALSMINDLTREVKAGEIYTGKVVRIMNFGAFVELLPGKDGLVHISELSDRHVPSVEDVVNIGEEITVIVTEIDSMGRINLSRRALLAKDGDSEGGEEGGSRPPASRPPSDRGDSRPPRGRSDDRGGRGYRPQGGGDRRGGGGSRGGSRGNGQRGGYRPSGSSPPEGSRD